MTENLQNGALKDQSQKYLNKTRNNKNISYIKKSDNVKKQKKIYEALIIIKDQVLIDRIRTS